MFLVILGFRWCEDPAFGENKSLFFWGGGSPNMYGLLGGEANKIEPGKRMLSSMTPTIVVKDGATVLVTGSPGGSTIINTVLHIVMNVILAQTFVIDGETKVRDAIKNAEKDAGAPIKLTKFVRYALGEGIEKVESDFAAEVAATSGVKQ